MGRGLVALLMLAGLARGGIELAIQFPVIEKLLGQQMFTEEGRRFVRGSKDSKCSFAYLAKPRVSAVDGKLAVKARFTGRSAWDVLGRCIGLGDDFDVTIVAIPYYRSGKLALGSVTVDSHGRDGVYIRRVRTALAASLEKDFAVPLAEMAKGLLEEPRPGAFYKQQLAGFQVSRVYISDGAVVFILDFRLTVK